MKKNFLLLILVCLSSLIMSQNFILNEMNNPDPNNYPLNQVFLFNNQALAGGYMENSLYYNGDSWSQLSSSPLFGALSGIKKENGAYALMANLTSLYSWNQANLNWQKITDLPDFGDIRMMQVYSENNAYICSQDNYNYGKIWHYSDTAGFQEKTSDYLYAYRNMCFKNDTNILFTTTNYQGSGAKLLRFNGQTLTTLYNFNVNRGNPISMHSNDNENLFILSDLGEVYKWKDSQGVMEVVYSYPESELGKYNRTIFSIDNNNIITAGKGGIRHIEVSSGNANVIQPTGTNFSFRASSYDNGRAIIVGDLGKIFEMLVANSVSEADVSASFQVYPNPVVDDLTVSFPVLGISPRLELYNSLGSLIFSYNLSSFEETISLSSLSSGMYFLRLTKENGELIAVKKVVKK